MRNHSLLHTLAAVFVLGITQAVMASTPSATPLGADSVKDKAVALLERNLASLREHRTSGGQYAATFAEGARVYCDVCVPPAPMPFEQYYFQVTGTFPNGLDLMYTIHHGRIEMERVDVEYHVTIPFTKDVPAMGAGGPIPGKRQRSHLKALVVYNFTNGYLRIKQIELDQAPGSNLWMLDVSPMLAVGKPELGALADLAPSWNGNMFQVGLMRYMYPGKGTNRGNMWLKAGLRAGLRQVRLQADGVAYETTGIALRPTSSGLPAGSAVQHHLDLSQRVSDINEKVTSMTLEVPVGLSKRWAMSRKADLSLELELGIGMELTRSVNGDYTMDQLGMHTFTWADGVDPVTSSGADLTYDQRHQAVTAASGTEYSFFQDDRMVLDDLESKARPYFFWGINPSVFVRGLNDQVKYQFGLRVAMVGTNRNSAVVDGTYFADQDDHARPALTTLVDGRFQPFVGVLFGIKL
ncbi:MAG: hypothetical protein R2815_11545 [Flavobacteriales bacterium]